MEDDYVVADDKEALVRCGRRRGQPPSKGGGVAGIFCAVGERSRLRRGGGEDEK